MGQAQAEPGCGRGLKVSALPSPPSSIPKNDPVAGVVGPSIGEAYLHSRLANQPNGKRRNEHQISARGARLEEPIGGVQQAGVRGEVPFLARGWRCRLARNGLTRPVG